MGMGAGRGGGAAPGQGALAGLDHGCEGEGGSPPVAVLAVAGVGENAIGSDEGVSAGRAEGPAERRDCLRLAPGGKGEGTQVAAPPRWLTHLSVLYRAP
jgi:hypothetical protein